MKQIVVGIGGTGMDKDASTNIPKIIARAEAAGATCIYRRGLGSKRGVKGVKERLLGGMGARGVNRVIRRLYMKVAAAYEPGDELFFFGYSRGGASAISLANLIWACGLPRDAAEMIGTPAESRVAHEAMKVYGARAGYAGGRRAEFSEKYRCHHPLIELLGLFDPVGALGLPLPNRLARVRFGQHDFSLRGHVRRYVALLALDEHRWAFRPILQTGEHYGQCVVQMWCPGCHGDVGGGYNKPLAEAPLARMIAEANICGLPLGQLDGRHYLPSQITDSWAFPHRAYPRVDRLPGIGRITGECLHYVTKEWLDAGLQPHTASWERAASVHTYTLPPQRRAR